MLIGNMFASPWRSRAARSIFLATLLLPSAAITPNRAVAAERFSFVAMGDAPYADPIDYLRFSGLIYRVNALRPTFTVHVGDFKSGGADCTDQRLTVVRDYFQRFESALIYTPGDNEWTDCHRLSAGAFDPLERLALLRRHYFAGPMSLGRAPIALERQSELTARKKFVENARWAHGGVGFLTAHVVGTYNNSERRDKPAHREFHERDAASAAWIDRGFRWVRDTGKLGLVVFIHADPLEGRSTDVKVGQGFKKTVTALTTGARDFGKPVLLVHGDFHKYKLDKPFFAGAERPIDTLTRLEVHGSPNVWATVITVDPADPALFKIAPLAAPETGSGPPD